MSSIIPVSFEGGVSVSAMVDGQKIVTDQPVGSGGLGSAPAPMDLFLASMATCSGFFALQFCRTRKIDTEGLGLTLHCTKSEEKHLFTDIRIELTLPPGFPEKYRSSITRSIEQCSVKRHLLEPPKVHTEIVG